MGDCLRIIMIGDVAGKPGMKAVQSVLPQLVAKREIDFVVANGENAAGGVGIMPDMADELFAFGVHCITTGNHIWRCPEIKDYIKNESRLLRPLNFQRSQPGRGMGIFETAAGITVGVINLAGRVFMDPADSPFTAAEAVLKELKGAKVRLLDFHAEATSEKRAMGHYLDGRMSAVVGTHTHVQTADEQVLNAGTAYITDIGMTGPHDSVIGMRKEIILERFVSGLPHPFKLASQGIRFQAVLIEIDTDSGLAEAIERIDIPVD